MSVHSKLPAFESAQDTAARYGYFPKIGSATGFDCAELQNLLQLWRQKCDGRVMPKRSDFTLRDFKAAASHIAFVEIVETNRETRRYRMRLLGDYLANVVDNVSSAFLDEHEDEGYREIQAAIFENLFAGCMPLRYEGPIPQEKLSHVHTDSLILPLSENGITPTAVLVAAWFSAPECNDIDTERFDRKRFARNPVDRQLRTDVPIQKIE